MARIDEIKEKINWLKELFKLLTMILVGLIAGLSKLFLDNKINILFYLGIIIGISILFWLVMLAVKINKNILFLKDIE
ncbi:MAG: hypothetical protein ABGX26_00185 [Nautiliaceae bacterium]|jgi:hypothetical protein